MTETIEVTQTPAFVIFDNATIAHLNLRKEGEDGEILCADIKIKFKRTSRFVLDYFDTGLTPFLWLYNNQKLGEPDLAGETGEVMMAVKNLKLAPISYSHEINLCDLAIGGVRLYGATVKKFQIQPLDGGYIEFICSASSEVSQDQVSVLSQYLAEEVKVKITEPSKLI